MTGLTFSGPELPPMKIRHGQAITIVGTYPQADIVGWSGFLLAIRPTPTARPIFAAVDDSNIAGASQQILFSLTPAQTRTIRPGSPYAFWATDADGRPVPLGAGIIATADEVKQ